MAMIFSDKIMTPRLRMRRLVEQDLPLLVDWSNSEIAHGEYLTPDRIDGRDGRDNIVNGAYWHKQNRLFLIELKNDQPIGTLHYWFRPERRNCAVMAVKIADPQQRNKGYGTEAQKNLIIQLFQRLRVESVEMYTDINNRPQQRCLIKLGFELVETLSYDDHQVKRVGHLFRIDAFTFANNPVYR
ncbi:MAG: GNAT family N-acetyltransferase [Desulfoprunum sp.]|nr:GNAT family N-acetyltransferase [Desulfoprunum sp.]